jgi:hypothetical protein
MKNATMLLGLLTIILSIGVSLFAQAQAVTPFPPEATAIPDGAVFIAPGHCAVSPDETHIALDENGVFDLSTGAKLYDFAEDEIIYSPDSRHFSARNGAAYDAQTGAVVIPAGQHETRFVPARAFSFDGRLFANSDGVYRLDTRDLVMPLNTGETVERRQEATFLPTGAIQVLYADLVEGQDYVRYWAVFYNPQNLEVILDTRDYLENMRFSLALSSDANYLLLGEAGVFTYPALERVIDFSDPDHGIGYIISTGFSADETKVGVVSIDYAEPESQFILQVFDLATGEILNTVDTPYGDGSFPDAITSALDRLNFQTPAWVYEAPNRVGNQYIDPVSGDVFDVATDTLIFDAPLGQNPTLTLGGSYIVTQYPCTVWTLP